MAFSRERGRPVPPPIPFEKYEVPFDQEPELSDDELEALLAENPRAQAIINELPISANKKKEKDDTVHLDEGDIEEIDESEDAPTRAKAA